MANRNPEYQFVPTGTGQLEADLTAAYEKITGRSLHPADPEKLFVQWVASIILQERVLLNYTGNQNIPSRAAGENLDALAELVFAAKRPGAKPAVCTERFYISEPQETAVLIPAGTRVTDAENTLIWETIEDAFVEAGSGYADVRIRCQTAGTASNGCGPGRLNVLVDVFAYYARCENTAVSEGGSDRMDDASFYEIMRASMDGYSTAGGMGNYAYHAKLVSAEIADVVPNSPIPGEVRLYVLMNDGAAAGEELKNEVLAACNADTVRPLTDHVLMGDPETVPYDIDFTYWVADTQTAGTAAVQKKVEDAVQSYIAWQHAKLGRDINPSVLIGMLMQTGIKRVALRSPAFTPLRDGRLMLSIDYAYGDTIPQVAAVRNTTILSGGYEDE